jgi:hypothetical protein
MLSSGVNKPQHPRRTPKLILDPGQTSFGFTVQEKPAPAGTEALVPAAKKRAGIKSSRSKSPPPDARGRPVRARISFEASGRLKRKLERVARERDRSKTALLRAALESYLRRPHVEDDDQ